MKAKTINFSALVTLFFMILSTIPVDARNLSFDISFDENKFDMTLDNEGLLHIMSKDTDKQYWFSDKCAPALPLLSYNYGLSAPCTYTITNIKKKKHLIDSCVIIAPNPVPIPTNETTNSIINNSNTSYESKVYPDDSIKISGSSTWSDFTILYMTVCPYEFDARTGELFFIDKITVDLEIKPDSSSYLPAYKCPESIKTISTFIDENSLKDNKRSDETEKENNLVI